MLNFLFGLFIGSILGMLALALVIAGKKEDEYEEGYNQCLKEFENKLKEKK